MCGSRGRGRRSCRRPAQRSSHTVGEVHWLGTAAPRTFDPSQPARSLADLRQVLVYPGEDGFWVAECPSLPGRVSQGETREQAIINIREAIEGYILALQDDGLPDPKERFDALLVAV